MFGGSFSQSSVFQLFPFSPLYLMICGAYILVPRRPDRTPSARQLAEVAGRGPFQAPACLTRCLRPERFVSISWDKQVNSCSYAGGKAPLHSLDHAGLLDALSRVAWQRCGS